MSDGVLLGAMDGSNPLAFLAALGTLRLLHLSEPHASVRMRWERVAGFWRPRLAGLNADENALCELLVNAPWAPVEKFEQIGKNLTVPRDKFAPFVQDAQQIATREDRRAADFAAAFGCEVCEDRRRDRIRFTNLCFITGSGHQDFLGTISALANSVTRAHIHDALFGHWRLEERLSMRWDPSDVAEYALRWDDPSSAGAWSVWGANRLAVEALPCFPTVPVQNSSLETTGFTRQNGWAEFSWPIWGLYGSYDTVRSLISLPELQETAPRRDVLRAMGIEEVYRAQRVRIGQGAHLKVNFRPARAV